MYKIIDTHTKLTVGTASTLKRASNSCAKRNMEYGATRYVLVTPNGFSWAS